MPASASSTSAANAPARPKKAAEPVDPFIGTQLPVGTAATTVNGVEYAVDPETGVVTGLLV